MLSQSKVEKKNPLESIYTLKTDSSVLEAKATPFEDLSMTTIDGNYGVL